MIVVAVVILAALSVPILGGSLSRLGGLRLRRPATIVAALFLQIVVISVAPHAFAGWKGQVVHLLSYALAVAFLWANRSVPGLWAIGAGGLSNLVAIGANGGVMPTSRVAMAAAGRMPKRGEFFNSGPLAHPHLLFLGDIFSVPRGVPLANVFSVGDVMLTVGAFILLHRVCRSRLCALRLRRRSSAADTGDIVAACSPSFSPDKALNAPAWVSRGARTSPSVSPGR